MKKYGHEISLTVDLKGKTVLTLGRNVLHISLTEYYFLIAILRRQYRITYGGYLGENLFFQRRGYNAVLASQNHN